MSLRATVSLVYPRVGGGTLPSFGRVLFGIGLSPRGRGNPLRRSCTAARRGSIPAWAGEPTLASYPNGKPTVYPRVGGGTRYIWREQVMATGLSPRGRGNCVHDLQGGVQGRSIPAWAGEPVPSAFRARVQTVYPRVGGGTDVT